MSEPFLAEVRMVGFNFPPRGWALTDGQILPINQNQALYSLLGTTYGGDGLTTFGLPEMRGRTPMHTGNGFTLGQKSGTEYVTLTAAEIPAHTHTVRAVSTPGDDRSPLNTLFGAEVASDLPYRQPEAASTTSLRSGTVTNAGSGLSHDNMQPYETVNFCIALQGLYPSRN
jgi:microcystin-dependent protein